jgi:oxygen-dependent protoporphyrinogen oxidase
MSSTRRVVVVGGGISGLAAAHHLLSTAASRGTPVEVTVLEAEASLGGKIRTSPFAGVPAVDEGPDAFLARVPWATALARQVGLGDELVSPAASRAAVWWHGLQPIPEGLLLGLPTDIGKLARSRLLSWRGKARAGLEPVLPRTHLDAGPGTDSVGAFVRARFGREVHERLVDPLVGSIYAADTDHFSLAAVPQLDDVARRSRSVLLGARRAAPAATASGPVFYAPGGGMGDLVDAAARAVADLGGSLLTGMRAEVLERHTRGWSVDGRTADAVVLACPAAGATRLLARPAPEAAAIIGRIETADVVMVTLAVPEATWPDRLLGMSGYLVPKPMQRLVTAASFGSQKWPQWHLPGQVVLRISLGRDGLPVLHLDDDELIDAAVTEVGRHLGIDLHPSAVRVTRWPGAFPQYRPLHHRLVAEATAALPTGLSLSGASYHGIGIPACVRSGIAAADLLIAEAGGQAQ